MFKQSTLVLLLASLASHNVGVNAQAIIPDISTFPAACANQCTDTIEVVTLCSRQYSNNSTDLAACFCNDLPSTSQLQSCGTCLTSNDAGSLGTALTQVETYCTSALTQCLFECDFPICAGSDVACQCSEDYLQNIYNCGSCNTRNNNAGATSLTNYNELRDSCVLQNYTATPASTEALPSPTGQNGYVAPTLTNTRGATVSGGSSTGVVVISASGAATTLPLTSRASGAAASSISSVASSIRSAASDSTARSSMGSARASDTTRASGTAVPAATTSTGNGAERIGGAVGMGAVVVGLVGLAGLI